MSWVSLHVTPSDASADVVGALFAAGSQGVHHDGAVVITHFPPGTDVTPIERAVRAADPGATIVVGEAGDTDWTEAWKSRIGRHDLGAITVAPPWLASGLDTARSVIVEPAMAFGTGEHATTRGVLRLMQRVIRPGDVVADLGAGSAVLAIASVKLGAARAVAIENDSDAISNAEENVERNGLAGRVTVIEGDAGALLPLVAPVRLIVANIISSVLTELLPLFSDALAADGVAILSGILVDEREAMTAVIGAAGWRVVAEDAEDVWWSALIARS